MLYGYFTRKSTGEKALGLFIPSGARADTDMGLFVTLDDKQEIARAVPYLNEEHLLEYYDVENDRHVTWVDHTVYDEFHLRKVNDERKDEYVEKLEAYCDRLYDTVIHLLIESRGYSLPERPPKFQPITFTHEVQD